MIANDRFFFVPKQFNKHTDGTRHILTTTVAPFHENSRNRVVDRRVETVHTVRTDTPAALVWVGNYDSMGKGYNLNFL